MEIKTLPLSEVKAKLSELVAQVANTDDRIVVTRHGRAVAVLVGQEDYDSWRETIAILSDEDLMCQIRKWRQAPRRGIKRYTVEELFGE